MPLVIQAFSAWSSCYQFTKQRFTISKPFSNRVGLLIEQILMSYDFRSKILSCEKIRVDRFIFSSARWPKSETRMKQNLAGNGLDFWWTKPFTCVLSSIKFDFKFGQLFENVKRALTRWDGGNWNVIASASYDKVRNADAGQCDILWTYFI